MQLDVKLGLTVPLEGFGNLRMDLGVNGLDPEADVDAQIERAVVVATKVYKRFDVTAEALIVDTISTDAGKPGVAHRLEIAESTLAVVQENLRRTVDRVKTLGEQLKQAVEKVNDGQVPDA